MLIVQEGADAKQEEVLTLKLDFGVFSALAVASITLGALAPHIVSGG
jgi:hypothetical protein